MLRKITVIAMYIAFGFVAVHAGQDVEVVDLSFLEPIEDPMRGFGGYAFGSSQGGIEIDMRATGYTLIDGSDESLWYATRLAGLYCELGYIFKNDRLIGGSFIVKSATEEDFAKVEKYLTDAYGVESEITIREDGVVVSMIDGPDATITHTLDLNKQEHDVTYVSEE